MQITVKKKMSFSSWQPSPWAFSVEPGQSAVSCDVNERFSARTAGNLDEESCNSTQSENISYLRTEYVGNHTTSRSAHSENTRKDRLSTSRPLGERSEPFLAVKMKRRNRAI